MNVKAYTRFEVALILIVMVILGYLGGPSVQNIFEDSKAYVCETNLKALKASLDVYVIEHDAFPGDLSRIPLKTLQKEYAKILSGKDGWKIQCAHAILGFNERGVAYAGLASDLATGNPAILYCPSALPGDRSYGFWAGLAVAGIENPGLDNKRYLKIPDGQILVGDCLRPTFEHPLDLMERHKHFRQNYSKTRYAQGLVKKQVEVPGSGVILSGIICEVFKGRLFSKITKKMLVFEKSQDEDVN